jgi:hypothetical protein
VVEQMMKNKKERLKEHQIALEIKERGVTMKIKERREENEER